VIQKITVITTDAVRAARDGMGSISSLLPYRSSILSMNDSIENRYVK
jgi:hypothetical protein